MNSTDYFIWIYLLLNTFRLWTEILLTTLLKATISKGSGKYSNKREDMFSEEHLPCSENKKMS